MVKKSGVKIVIYYGGGAEVLVPATFARAVVLEAGASRGTEDAEAVGNGAVVAGAGIDDAGT